MRKRLKRMEDLPMDMFEALNQICTEKAVLYTNELFVDKIRTKRPCQIMSIHTGRLDSAAFTLVKKSPYRGVINF